MAEETALPVARRNEKSKQRSSRDVVVSQVMVECRVEVFEWEHLSSVMGWGMGKLLMMDLEAVDSREK